MKPKENAVTERVICKINNFFGDDISGLNRVNEFKSSLEKQREDIENRLDHANSSVSHDLQDLLNSGDELERKVNKLSEEFEELLATSRDASEQCRTFGEENKEILSDISCVRGVTQYTLWLRLIEQVNLDLSVSLETKDKTQIVIAYKKLVEVSSSLKGTKCANLKNYVDSVVEHWYKLLSDTYINLLQSSLDQFSWPFVETLVNKKSLNDLLKTGSDDVRNLQDSIEILLRIQEDTSGQEENIQLNLPLRIMMKPLRKRFKYHFLGTKTTNNPSKPEWFTTQLSTWALAHRQFLKEYVQPVYDRVGEPRLVIMDFAQGLVSLAVDKLCVDIPIVMDDDVRFAHTIDEIIGFSRDMSNTMQYSSSQPSVLEPLTTQGVFTRWLNMERKFAFEKVDNLFMEPGTSVWESEVCDSLTPRAAETFLALLLSVTERYKFLSVSHHRLQFLQLQLDLIEDFRVRLVQLVRTEKNSPLSSNLCPIINTLDHLILVLGNWAETPFFLQLQFQRCAQDTEETETSDNHESEMDKTVFDESIEELKYLRENLIKEVVDAIFYTVTARSLKYRTETKWFNMTDVGKALSPSVCEMLQSLAFGLDTARRRINTAAFQLVWRELAGRLHTFILEEIVLQNKFCIEGGEQLEYDMNNGFFPIFGEFTPSPQSYFKDLNEVLKLLTSQPGPLILAYNGLQETCEEGGINILAELGVHNLTVQRATRVMQMRMDLEL